MECEAHFELSPKARIQTAIIYSQALEHEWSVGHQICVYIIPVEGIAGRVTGRISIDVEASYQRALCRTLVSFGYSCGLKVPEVAAGTRPDTLVQSHRFRRIIASIGNSKAAAFWTCPHRWLSWSVRITRFWRIK